MLRSLLKNFASSHPKNPSKSWNLFKFYHNQSKELCNTSLQKLTKHSHLTQKTSLTDFKAGSLQIKMDENDHIRRGLDSQERLFAIAKRLTDIGDALDRKARKNHFPYAGWMCIVTVLLTISTYCCQTKDPDMSYL